MVRVPLETDRVRNCKDYSQAVGTKQSQPKKAAISTSGSCARGMRVPRPLRTLAMAPCVPQPGHGTMRFNSCATGFWSCFGSIFLFTIPNVKYFYIVRWQSAFRDLEKKILWFESEVSHRLLLGMRVPQLVALFCVFPSWWRCFGLWSFRRWALAGGSWPWVAGLWRFQPRSAFLAVSWTAAPQALCTEMTSPWWTEIPWNYEPK